MSLFGGTPVTRLVAVAAVLGLLAASCGGSDDDDGGGGGATTTQRDDDTATEFVEISGVPGVTDEEIRFAGLGVNSNNPLGTCVLECFLHGVKAYFAYRNSEGGIYGRELALSQEVDDEFGKNQQKALELISANDVFGVFSSTILPSGWAEFAKADWPVYALLTDPAAGAHPNIFGSSGIECVTCTRLDTVFLAQANDATKVAALGLGVSEASKECSRSIVDAYDKYEDEVDGATVVYHNEDLPYGFPNGAGPEVTAMKDAGVELIFACTDQNSMKVIGQELQRQGMDDVVMVHRSSYDAVFVSTNKELFEGDIIADVIRPIEADAGDGALDEFKEWMERAGEDITWQSIHGWVVATAAYDGLVAAGAPFDRQGVIDATNRIEDFTGGGMVAPVDFGRQHEPATEADPITHGADPACRTLLRVVDGKFTFLPPSSESKPFVCWPGDSREWSEPVGTDFK